MPLTAAARTREIAYLVLMASPGISLYDTLVLQDGTEAIAAGKSEAEAELIRGFSRRFYGLVLRSKDASEIDARDEGDLRLSDRRGEAGAQGVRLAPVAGKSGHWPGPTSGRGEDLGFDIGPSLRKVRCPVLALIGARDCSGSSEGESRRHRGRGSQAGGNKSHTVRELPNLNHLFQTCSTGATAEYSKIDETMAPLLLQTVSEWIVSRTRKGEGMAPAQ